MMGDDGWVPRSDGCQMGGYMELSIAYRGNAGFYRSEKIKGFRLLNANRRSHCNSVIQTVAKPATATNRSQL